MAPSPSSTPRSTSRRKQSRGKRQVRQSPTPLLPGNVPARRLSSGRKLLFAAAAVAFVLTVAVLLAELLMRLLEVRPSRHERPITVVLKGGVPVPDRPGARLVKTTSRFKALGVDMGEYVPNTVFKTVYDANPRGYFDADGGVISEINSLGLRGPEVRSEKTTGTVRILGIGDSFTYGAGVRDEDTFLRRLEQSLNRQYSKSGAARYEVLNAGVEGYNTRDEVVTLENRWLALRPDLILIGFYLNDCYKDHSLLNRGEAQAVHMKKPPGLAQYSFLWDYARHAWTAYRESEGIKHFYQKQYFSNPGQVLDGLGEVDADWSASRQALARAAEIGRREGIPVAVIIFPELYSLNDSYPFRAVHDHVAAACRNSGLPVLDLFDAFKRHDEEELWVHPADHHPNEIGHRIAAEAIERFLSEQGLLKTP